MKYCLLLPLLLLGFCTRKLSSHQLLKDVAYLASDSLKGRKTGTPEGRLAADFVARRFQALGLQSFASDYRQPFSFASRSGGTVQGVNVVGAVPGRIDSVIVISAHYDHIGVIGGKVFNGADDNASGTAALLQLAAYFAKRKPTHTLVFAAFDAEEMGLMGSKAFVDNPPVPLSKMKLNLNMDMVSRNDKGELYAAGTFHQPKLKALLPAQHGGVKLLAGHDNPAMGRDDWTFQSDHGSFHRKGIPFLYFGVEDHADYHKETDEIQHINQAFFVDAVELVKQTLLAVDRGF